jgi:hypothetical protein
MKDLIICNKEQVVFGIPSERHFNDLWDILLKEFMKSQLHLVVVKMYCDSFSQEKRYLRKGLIDFVFVLNICHFVP